MSLFRTSGDVYPVFQSKSGFPHLCDLSPACDCYLRCICLKVKKFFFYKITPQCNVQGEGCLTFHVHSLIGMKPRDMTTGLYGLCVFTME